MLTAAQEHKLMLPEVLYAPEAGKPILSLAKAQKNRQGLPPEFVEDGEYKKETAPYIKSFSTEPISSAPSYSSESNGIAERLNRTSRQCGQ